MPEESRESLRAQQDEVARKTARRWADWLVRTRTARGKRPIDLVEAARAVGEKLTTGQISNWEGARNTASPESARLVARLLRADPVEALRAAGHDDWADFAAELRGGNIQPPVTSVIDDALAVLRASDLPEDLKHKFEDEYTSVVEPLINATEAWQRNFAEQVDQALRRKAEREQSEGEIGSETA